MPSALKVLHLTAHLGGGIGRALAALAAQNKRDTIVEDSFICLETPRDTRFADAIRDTGADIALAPTAAAIRAAVAAANIVQIEWWHHPLLAKTLLDIGAIPARWLVWAHTSGLHYPVISPSFAALPHAFVATSAATLPLLADAKLSALAHSTGGFDGFAPPRDRKDGKIRAGYLGSLNPAKIHPDIVNYIAALGVPGLHVDFYGETGVNPRLEEEVRRWGGACPVKLRGFCDRPQDILPALDLFIYLLNPSHYGTTENALLEAMACGVIPIVMNNPVESGIVQDGETGFVVKNIEDFTATIHRLIGDRALREKIAAQAAASVRRDYAVSATAEKLAAIYRTLYDQPKSPADFRALFGASGGEIFLSGLGRNALLFTAGQEEALRGERLAMPALYEKSKSSAFQFRAYFPDDARLAAYEATLYDDLTHAERIS
ncbi:MAG: glycosyltransferase family 4 protein [Negativicutes bacterium]|nr:glycosyltransferase family 4 protein [Negativicutes bacterium]